MSVPAEFGVTRILRVLVEMLVWHRGLLTVEQQPECAGEEDCDGEVQEHRRN
jgi:hypothetical protein